MNRDQRCAASARPRLNPLEDRLVPALVAVGGEFAINSSTAGSQVPGGIAVAADGSFVVVWNSQETGALGYEVVAQRFGPDGTSLGGEFHANTYTTGNQGGRAIAIDADGDFVIAWDSAGQDGSAYGIYARRYNAIGVPQGDEFLVNTFTTGDQFDPAIAMNAAGDFTITWTRRDQIGTPIEIDAQRFDAFGTPVGGEFQINLSTTENPLYSKIAMDQEGDFVVVWQNGNLGSGPDGSTYGVYARRFDSAGTPQGTDFRVNSRTTGAQWFPTVAMNSTGEFVVAWTSGFYFGSDTQDGNLAGIYAQVYHADGSPDGIEFRVNTYTTGVQWLPAAAIDATGNFIVAWESGGQDGSGAGVFAQAFRSHGLPDGSEYRVNSFTTGDQNAAMIAVNAAGDIVIGWQSADQDGSGNGVFGQRYQFASSPQVADVAVNGGAGQRSRLTRIAVYFDAQVAFAGDIADAFTLTRNGGGSVSFTATSTVVGGVTLITLDNFVGPETQSGSLNDGRYTLTVLASQISADGQQMAANFTFGDAQGLYRFYGDVNGDRRVDIADFGFFSLAYLSPPNFNAALDFNNDGRIDIADFGQFSVRFFTTLP